MILCDIGNSSFHFRKNKKTFKIAVNENLESLPSYKKKSIYFISVNQKASNIFLKKFPHAINLEKMIDFQTAYKGMGIDRKMVCYRIQDGIIVDAGSAITVDIMKNNIHQGGFILPGINAYKSIYQNISQKLSFDFEKNINLDKIPLTTNDAINYALLSAITLPIIKQYEKYKMKIYVTGGDRNIFKKYFKTLPTVYYKKNMIFSSMYALIKKYNKEKKGELK